MHTRFKFPDEYDNLDQKKNQVNNHAIHKFSKTLSTWKSYARKLLDEDFSVVHAKWPTISEEDWNTFKSLNESPTVISHSTWGKDMRSKTLSNHTLGSRGFVGKKPKWDKQDAILAAKGDPNPFSQFKDELEYNYVRARFHYDEKTGSFSADHQTKKLMEELSKQHAEAKSSQGSTARWDTPLNRSINITLGKDVLTPQAGGRVNGAGCDVRWDHHLPINRDLQRQKRKENKLSLEQKILKATVDAKRRPQPR